MFQSILNFPKKEMRKSAASPAANETQSRLDKGPPFRFHPGVLPVPRIGGVRWNSIPSPGQSCLKRSNHRSLRIRKNRSQGAGRNNGKGQTLREDRDSSRMPSRSLRRNHSRHRKRSRFRNSSKGPGKVPRRRLNGRVRSKKMRSRSGSRNKGRSLNRHRNVNLSPQHSSNRSRSPGFSRTRSRSFSSSSNGIRGGAFTAGST